MARQYHKQPKYIAGYYDGNRFCVRFLSNNIYSIQNEADANNLELRVRLTAIKKNNKRINPEYKVLRHITDQLRMPCI